MINTKDSIVSLFGYNEFCIYSQMDKALQEKYRLYITRRINANVFYCNDTMSPSYWLEQYNEKKSFEYIASKLNIDEKEVREIYNNALKKMNNYFRKKKTKLDDYI